jgi:hypothetical protein
MMGENCTLCSATFCNCPRNCIVCNVTRFAGFAFHDLEPRVCVDCPIPDQVHCVGCNKWYGPSNMRPCRGCQGVFCVAFCFSLKKGLCTRNKCGYLCPGCARGVQVRGCRERDKCPAPGDCRRVAGCVLCGIPFSTDGNSWSGLTCYEHTVHCALCGQKRLQYEDIMRVFLDKLAGQPTFYVCYTHGKLMTAVKRVLMPLSKRNKTMAQMIIYTWLKSVACKSYDDVIVRMPFKDRKSAYVRLRTTFEPFLKNGF